MGFNIIIYTFRFWVGLELDWAAFLCKAGNENKNTRVSEITVQKIHGVNSCGLMHELKCRNINTSQPDVNNMWHLTIPFRSVCSSKMETFCLKHKPTIYKIRYVLNPDDFPEPSENETASRCSCRPNLHH